MRLWNIMEYFHQARVMRIESEKHLDDVSNDTEEVEKNNEDTKSQDIKDTCYMKQEEIKEDLNIVQEDTNEHRTDLQHIELDRKRQEELKRE
ncbi:hypothetical protein Bpfe_008022, partial [Biomphalaria pfeifferi]